MAWLASIIIAALLGPAAFSAPIPIDLSLARGCDLFHQADFIPAQEAIQKIHAPVALLTASPKILFSEQGDEESICSSTVISDSGLLLTAGHCLRNCADNRGLLRESDDPKGNWKMSQLDLSIKDGSAPLQCFTLIDGKPLTVEVIAAKHCRFVKKNEKTPMADRKACEGSADFALLRVPKRTAGQPCVKSISAKGMIGKKILAVGYPSRTQRKNLNSSARDSDGENQYISFGTVMYGDWCHSAGNKNDLFSIAAETEARPEMLQLDADIVPGNSGGPVVSNGRLVGEISSTASSSDLHCVGGAWATTVDQMKASLKTMGWEDPSELFRCQAQAIWP
jgi:hypothetical protein